MKRLICFLILLPTFGIDLSGQCSMQIFVRACRTAEYHHWPVGFSLFRNDIFYETDTVNFSGLHELTDLPVGNYRIDYKTFFGKTESQSVILEKGNYQVYLCLDYLDSTKETYVPFIDRLENGEKFIFEYSSLGCFHHEEKSLQFCRKNDKYYVSIEKQEILLTPDQISFIRQFELELNYMNDDGCTTVENYYLKYKNEEVKISDGGCQWWGYQRLEKVLNF